MKLFTQTQKPVTTPGADLPAPYAETTTFVSSTLGNWYSPVLLGPGTIGDLAASSECLQKVITVLRQLEPDDYVRFLLAYYEKGINTFGTHWKYADITTVLLATAELVQPKHYLEIGVRRGRSMAMVAATCPTCDIVGFDMWVDGYAGMENPGPDFVRAEMTRLGYSGTLDLISGNSHETVSRYLDKHPQLYFDLITVDGDHSPNGAAQDLTDVLPRVAIGGVVVFDDISHPHHPALRKVWHDKVASNADFKAWEFTELGYGVGAAIRTQ